MKQISPFCKVKQNFATTAVIQPRVQRTNPSKQRNRNMKPSRKPDARLHPKVQKNHLRKTAARAPMDVDAGSSSEPFVGPFSRDEFQWPPVEVPRRFRSLSVDTTLPRCRSVKPHAVLGVNVATGRRGSSGLRPRRPVPFPLCRVPSSHLSGVLRALGTDTLTVGTPVGTLVTKIQNSACSAFAAVKMRSVIQVSQVSNVAGATTQLLQENMKLHPVLGIYVPTRRRSLPELCAHTLLTPVFATMFGYLFRNETLTWLELVGSIITLASICFVKVEKPETVKQKRVPKTTTKQSLKILSLGQRREYRPA